MPTTAAQQSFSSSGNVSKNLNPNGCFLKYCTFWQVMVDYIFHVLSTTSSNCISDSYQGEGGRRGKFDDAPSQ